MLRVESCTKKKEGKWLLWSREVANCTLLEFLPTKSERNTYVLVCRGNLPTVFEGITYCMQYL